MTFPGDPKKVPRPISYDALMALSEDDIKALFPKGATEVKKDRWQPTERGKADKTLSQLLRAKKRRQETPRFLKTSSGYTTKTKGALGKDGRYASESEIGAEAEPQAVDAETQERFSREAGRRFKGDRGDEVLEMQAKLIATKIAKLQREGARFGVDLAPRLQALIREGQQEIVQQRRSAA